MERIINALTIDVEDYFQVHAFSSKIRYSDWPSYNCRVERNTCMVLDILSEIGVRGTFFTLGWIAERYPKLIKKIAEHGHEIASHGYRHELVGNQKPEEFREDVARTKQILEDITGAKIFGYRASTYSISKKTSWALKILAEEGYSYDSSIFPVLHDVYGIPDAPRFPFRVDISGLENNLFRGVDFSPAALSEKEGQSAAGDNDFWEFPVSTSRIWGRNIPVSGGGYFRFFPYWFTKKCLKGINKKENGSFIFYVHPWEFDPGQPRITGISLRSKFRHYLNLEKVEDRFRKLLNDFRFVPILELLQKYQTPG